MPLRYSEREALPDWIYQIAYQYDNDCVLDVLTEMWNAHSHARKAIETRGEHAPRRCLKEYESARTIMTKIQNRTIKTYQRISERAAVAVRKFTTARQCAIMLEHENSPTYARDRRAARRRRRRVVRSRS
jgi:hypothetical protein